MDELNDNGKAEPMVRLADIQQAMSGLCEECGKRVRNVLLARLSTRIAEPEPGLPRQLVELRRKVAKRHGFDEEVMVARSLTQSRVAARREFAQKARVKGYSLIEIGEALRRDHSSITNLLRDGGRRAR